MFVARLICSDSECSEQTEVRAATVGELEVLACECGCGFEIIGWPDWVGDDARILALPDRLAGEPIMPVAA